MTSTNKSPNNSSNSFKKANKETNKRSWLNKKIFGVRAKDIEQGRKYDKKTRTAQYIRTGLFLILLGFSGYKVIDNYQEQEKYSEVESNDIVTKQINNKELHFRKWKKHESSGI